MTYIDFFVAPVDPNRKDDFIAFSRLSHEVIMECGALSVLDAWDDDVAEGEVTSFRRAVHAETNEVVTAGWII